MTKVITLEPRSGRRSAAAERSGPAEILLFTGVRYVRDDEPVPGPGAGETPEGPDGGSGQDRPRRRRA